MDKKSKFVFWKYLNKQSLYIKICAIVAIIFLVFYSSIFLLYGTISPCSALKRKMHEYMLDAAKDSVFATAILSNIMPAMDAKIDELSLLQCTRGLMRDIKKDTPVNSLGIENNKSEEDASGEVKLKKLTENWNYSEDVSPVDDSKTIVISRLSAEEVGSGYSAYRPWLGLRCKENQTDLFVQTQEMVKTTSLLDDGHVPIIIRFDSNPPEEASMDTSTDNHGFFFPKPIDSIKRLEKTNKLVIRYYTFSGDERTAIFDVAGLSEYLPKLSQACHWPEK